MTEICDQHGGICEKLGQLEGRNGGKYVTYKWLIASSLSTLASALLIFLAFINYTHGILHKEIELKASKESVSALCSDVKEIRDAVKDNEKLLSYVKEQQIRVLQKLDLHDAKMR